MAETAEKREEGISGDPNVIVSTTLPDELRRHDISDEQLTMLVGLSSGNENQLLWIMIGGAVGSISAAVSNFYHAYFAPNPVSLTFGALFEIVVFATTAALAAVCYKIVGWRRNSASVEAQGIRERTRKRYSTVQLQVGQPGAAGEFERTE